MAWRMPSCHSQKHPETSRNHWNSTLRQHDMQHAANYGHYLGNVGGCGSFRPCTGSFQWHSQAQSNPCRQRIRGMMWDDKTWHWDGSLTVPSIIINLLWMAAIYWWYMMVPIVLLRATDCRETVASAHSAGPEAMQHMQLIEDPNGGNGGQRRGQQISTWLGKFLPALSTSYDMNIMKHCESRQKWSNM
jgi:hypothetical protein